jgi:Zn-dependent M16 (insulinase) family peptidase
MNLTEELLARNKKVLQSIKDRPPSDVQDTSRLPLVQVADFEFLEETIKETVEVAGIKTTLVDGG